MLGVDLGGIFKAWALLWFRASGLGVRVRVQDLGFWGFGAWSLGLWGVVFRL